MIQVYTQKDVDGVLKLAIVKHADKSGKWSRDAENPDHYLVLEPEPHWEPVVERMSLGVVLPSVRYPNLSVSWGSGVTL